MVVKRIATSLALYIMFMALGNTKCSANEATMVKALQDVESDATDKEKMALEESMAKSLVSTYEYIMNAAMEPGLSAYVGCFSVTKAWDHAKTIKVDLGAQNSANRCIWKCWERRQRFALLWFGAQCWCVNVIRNMKDEGDLACVTPCKGNQTQICGGVYKCSVYYTGYIHEPLYTHVTEKEITAAHQGCYQNSLYQSQCPVSPPSHRMSVPTCMDICENNLFRFAGLTTVDRCCCDHNLTSYAKKDAGYCSSTCRYQGRDYPCGGKTGGYFSVYETGANIIVDGLKTFITKQIWMEANINDDDIRVFIKKPAG